MSDTSPSLEMAEQCPQNLHQAITLGIESALADFGFELDARPALLTGHVIRELKRIPGWRPPVREITEPAELDALPDHSIVRCPTGGPWLHVRIGGAFIADWRGDNISLTSEQLLGNGCVTLLWSPSDITEEPHA